MISHLERLGAEKLPELLVKLFSPLKCILNLRFILYKTEKLIQTHSKEKSDLERPNRRVPVELEKPKIHIANGFYRHSFPCTLSKAIMNPKCLLQIFHIRHHSRFYHSMTDMISFRSSATRFPVLFILPIYIFSIWDSKSFHKIKFLISDSVG